VAVVALLVLGVGGYVAYKKFMGPPPASTYIEINGIPWGTVKSITSVDGKMTLSPNEQTPVRVAVPPGDYKVVVDGPDGQEQSLDVKATNDIPGSVTPVFQQIDVDQIINASN